MREVGKSPRFLYIRVAIQVTKKHIVHLRRPRRHWNVFENMHGILVPNRLKKHLSYALKLSSSYVTLLVLVSRPRLAGWRCRFKNFFGIYGFRY